MDKNNIQFSNEKLTLEGDSFFYQILTSAERISIINSYLYNRRINEDSIWGLTNEILFDNIELAKIILDYFIGRPHLYDYYKKEILTYIFNSLFNIKYYQINDNLKEEFYNRVQRACEFIIGKYGLYSDIKENINEEILEFFKFDEIAVEVLSPKISVIISVYNVEKYLRECLDSVLNQTLRSLEIICVNDGSTDNSLSILKEYQNHDSRIKIITKENHGLSSARNAGLNLASGKYVYFIDSDDYIECDALNELYDLAINKDLDMVLFKLISFWDDSKERFISPYLEMAFLKGLVGDNVFSFNDLGSRLYDLAVVVPGVLFKRDLISDLRFPEGLIFEDNVFFTEAVLKAKWIYFHDKHLYNYRMRNESITNSGSNFSDIIEIRNMVNDIAKKYDYFDSCLYSKKLYGIVSRFSQVSDENKKDFFTKIKEDFINHQEEYESSDEFNNLPINEKSIFYAGLNANNYVEFEKMASDNNLKISVIIPIYNVENYLSQCLDSVLNQSLKDLEVICVNDGSTDNSLKILESYAEMDSRVKIISQENNGPGNALNNGLKYANGKYVLFVDSDDFISKNSLEKVLNNAVSNNSDIVLFNNQEFDEIENTVRPYSYIPENYFANVNYNHFTFTFKDIKNTVLNTYFSAASKLFKKEFLEKNNLSFPEETVFEAILFHVKTMLCAKSISFLPEVAYNYRISFLASIMHDKTNSFDIFNVIDSVELFLIDSNLFNEFQNEFIFFKITQLIQHTDLNASNDFFQLAKKELFRLKNFTDILPDYKKTKFYQIINSNDFDEYYLLSN